MDPVESNNLCAKSGSDCGNPFGFSALLNSIAVEGARKPATQSDDPEARKALMQLGYVSGPTQANDDLPRPDPKDVIQLLPMFDKARGQAQKGHCQDAIPALQDILKQNPGNVPVMAQLGWCQIELKNPRAAIPIYASTIKLRPDWDILHYQLGNALLQVEDKPGAEREWKAALVLNPRFAPAAASLVQSARLAGRTADAEQALAGARRAQLEDSDLEGEAALLAVARKDLPGAERFFLAALKLDPKNVAARANLANLYYQRKDIIKTLKLYDEGIALLPGEGQFLKPAAAILLEECTDARGCASAEQAIRYFRQYLARNPDAPDAPQVREVLGDLEAGPR
jgi:predicted Zn-dependent protease